MSEHNADIRILLAAPRGFCAGVVRAIEIVERALEKYGAPVYVRHEIVHNRFVVDGLRAKGAIFVEELDDIPEAERDRPVIFSAHGVPRSVPEAARARNMHYIDATCPLVSKVHLEAARHHEAGRHISPPDPSRLAYVTQTTLSVDETRGIVEILRERFPDLVEPVKDDICYATTNRQEAVKAMAGSCDMLLVVGAPNSSNSRRLVEVAKKHGCPNSMLVQVAEEIDWAAIRAGMTVGLTAGASAPEVLVNGVIEAFRARYDVDVEVMLVKEENISFKLPRELREAGEA